MDSENLKIHHLPILSRVSYPTSKALKYHLSTTRLRLSIHKIGDSGKLNHYRRIQHFISVEYCPTGSFRDLYSFLGKVNRLKSISIDFSKIRTMTPLTEKILSKCFQHLRSISRVKLCSSENPSMNDIKVDRICRALQLLKCCKEACFDFFRCYQLSEDGAVSAMKHMSKMPLLEKLRINYESCHDQSSRGIAKMGECLKNFKSLKDFAFSICALSVFTTNISEEGFSKFVEYLSEHKQMENLYVHFRNIQNNNVLRYLSKKISEMPKLINLNIHLTGFVKVDDIGFEHMGQNIGRMNGMKQLNLDLRSSSEITDECVVVLCKELSNIKTLENLLFNFNACQKITDKSIKAIGDCITKYPRLRILHLQILGFSLFMPSIGEEGLVYLAQKITELQDLRALGLDIGNSAVLDDDFIVKLFENIIKLQKLVKLQLNIENLSKLTDASLRTISHEISKMNQLDTLDIYFQNCYNFTDEGVTTFLNRLRQNRVLKEVRLGFAGSGLSPEVVEYGKSVCLWRGDSQ